MKNIYILLIAVLLIIGMISFAGTETNFTSSTKKTGYTVLLDPIKILWIDSIIQELYYDLIGSPGMDYHYGSPFLGYGVGDARSQEKWDNEYISGMDQSRTP